MERAGAHGTARLRMAQGTIMDNEEDTTPTQHDPMRRRRRSDTLIRFRHVLCMYVGVELGGLVGGATRKAFVRASYRIYHFPSQSNQNSIFQLSILPFILPRNSQLDMAPILVASGSCGVTQSYEHKPLTPLAPFSPENSDMEFVGCWNAPRPPRLYSRFCARRGEDWACHHLTSCWIGVLSHSLGY
ncbi:hypothetical protein P154DRAFT_252295 [Amniculicola lignicola CBS 123094]|uniref:Uncharacterized protein n=1 Tax=Amniculicola lignicola CBS 123094 TaxID=1392246 RepID=A0A6A5WGW6_9PLEO|nr:hypothetical protein P154DRAFT_252295 [Amniculicola lignicola CBS 123094]